MEKDRARDVHPASALYLINIVVSQRLLLPLYLSNSATTPASLFVFAFQEKRTQMVWLQQRGAQPMKLEIRHLKHFNAELSRDVLVDARSRPVTIPDAELLNRIVVFGNAFLERARADPGNDEVVIWFDCHFGEPAVVGFTWAYNPFAPFDDLYGVDHFWRCWSEIAGDDEVATLVSAQQDFAGYTLQHVTA